MHNYIAHLLAMDSIVTGYGKKQIINGVSLNVLPGEIVALIGHNGAGKSTLLKTAFGMLSIWGGRVLLNGDPIHKANPRDLLRKGMVYIPQGSRVFNDLTVWENLEIGGSTLPTKARLSEGIDRALSLFPALRQMLGHRARTLSGGEKQMIALANALVLSPKLLLLDEPSLGLAPHLAAEALQRIQEISRDSRMAVLVVEQKVREVLKIASRVYVLRNGVVSFEGPVLDLASDTKMREVYF